MKASEWPCLSLAPLGRIILKFFDEEDSRLVTTMHLHFNPIVCAVNLERRPVRLGFAVTLDAGSAMEEPICVEVSSHQFIVYEPGEGDGRLEVLSVEELDVQSRAIGVGPPSMLVVISDIGEGIFDVVDALVSG